MLLPLALALPFPHVHTHVSAQAPVAIERLQSRYAVVEGELERADLAGLDEARRRHRAFLIGVLREYRTLGEFGRNPDVPGVRVPFFVDAEGRRCAVAQMLHLTGEDALVEEVHTRANHAWVVDLARDPRFLGWLERHGLTLEEAARIQGPAFVTQGSSTPNSAQGGGLAPETGRRAGPATPAPTYAGPASGPTSAGRPGPASAPAGGAPTGGASTGAPTPARPNPLTPTVASVLAQAEDSWWMWWEYNKVEFLRPNRLDASFLPGTGDDLEALETHRLANLRRSVLPPIRASLESTDASVRAAGAMALGRVAAGDSVEELLAVLADRHMDVRHRSILALGASGAPQAVRPLLAIAERGHAGEGDSARVSPLASPLAIVALGLGRRAGFDPRVAAEVARIARERKEADRPDVRAAALMAHMLSPAPELEALALEIARDRDEPIALRCRAVEALRTATDDATLSALQHLLSGPHLELRRSAALALGLVRHPLVLPPLMTAYELEAEPLARGFLLVSIGRQGGPQASGFLRDVLSKGDKSMRAWAALALGVLARTKGGDETIVKALREGAAAERNRDAIGAYWIAAGLARDPSAVPMLREGLASAGDARQRMYAATGLALLGGDVPAGVLRERLAREESSLGRVSIAFSLGLLGVAEDAPRLLGVLLELREPELQGLASSALAFHASGGGYRALAELTRLANGSPARQAAAIDGLGMLLGHSQALALGEVSRQSNHTMFPAWVREMLQTTL